MKFAQCRWTNNAQAPIPAHPEIVPRPPGCPECWLQKCIRFSQKADSKGYFVRAPAAQSSYDAP